MDGDDKAPLDYTRAAIDQARNGVIMHTRCDSSSSQRLSEVYVDYNISVRRLSAIFINVKNVIYICLLYTSPSPRD